MSTSNVPTPSMALGGHFRLRASVAGQRPVLGGGQLGRLLRGQQGEAVVRTRGKVCVVRSGARRAAAAGCLAADYDPCVDYTLLGNIE